MKYKTFTREELTNTKTIQKTHFARMTTYVVWMM